MCMEDVRIGREKYSRVTLYTSDGTGLAVIPSDPDRVSIIISGVAGQTVFVGDKPMAAANQGILAVPTVTLIPFRMTIEEFGDFVRNTIFVFSAAGIVVPVLETSLAKQ